MVALQRKGHFAEANRNLGILKPCMDCDKEFTSYMPLNLIWRPQRCSNCKVSHEKERVRLHPKTPEQRRQYRESHREQINAYRVQWRQTHSSGPTIHIAEIWPFGATGWPFEEVNAVVSKALPEVVRADVCQELCLMVISNELAPEDIQKSVRGVIRRVWGDYSISIDQRRSDGLALADQLMAEEVII